MGGSRSKNIGKAGESNVTRWLNEIFDNYIISVTNNKVEFRRVIGSGAHGHLVKQMPVEVQLSLAGDVYGPVSWPWIIEVKKRGDDSISKILKNDKHEFYDWADQVYNESSELHKKPMLVMDFGGRNNAWVAMLSTCINKLWKWQVDKGKPPRIKINVFHDRVSHIESWVIMHWIQWETIVRCDLSAPNSYLRTVTDIRERQCIKT